MEFFLKSLSNNCPLCRESWRATINSYLFPPPLPWPHPPPYFPFGLSIVNFFYLFFFSSLNSTLPANPSTDVSRREVGKRAGLQATYRSWGPLSIWVVHKGWWAGVWSTFFFPFYFYFYFSLSFFALSFFCSITFLLFCSFALLLFRPAAFPRAFQKQVQARHEKTTEI